MELTELASGVDSLYLSGRTELPTSLLERLATAKECAQEDGPVEFSLGGYDWTMAPAGFGKYRYRLNHPAAVIGLTPGRKLPGIRVQARAEALHSKGPAALVRWAETVFANEGIAPTFTVSRIDLHADWQGWSVSGDDRHRFVCRARDLATYEDNFELSGFSFGNRKSGSMNARIYDKTREMASNGHDWWPAVWGDRYDDTRPVHRVEFEFARGALHEMRLSSPDETLAAIGKLWAYATQSWLTYRTPSDHERPSRWPLSPQWARVQNASLAHGAVPIERISDGNTAGGLRLLMPLLNGCVAAFASLVGAVGISDACERLPIFLAAYEDRSGQSFADRIIEKRKRRAAA
ncbi:MAG: hypothetical protein AB7Q42_09675 [Acidimicrobiia bacterium]